jgi:hypothetical protein
VQPEPATLTVEADGTTHTLGPADELTFGRDPSCSVRLSADDAGISRRAGRIRVEGGAWFVTNTSRTRPLHIVDANGFTAPLPVAKAGWPTSRRAVDQPQLTVLVPSNTWTYALTVRTTGTFPTDCPAPPESPVSTVTPRLQLTDNRREVLVALARGYLRPYPHYDPRPEGYDDIAELLGLSRSAVTRRIEDVRVILAESGVEGLDRERDTRRPLCEWLLAMRLVTPADLDWLTSRVGGPRRSEAQRPAVAGPEAERPAERGGGTSEFAKLPRVRIGHAAYRAAQAVAPRLRARLIAVHGENWLDQVNAARRRGDRNMRPATSLEDDRICLAVLAHDRATVGWAPRDVRDAAAALKALADTAAHNRPLRPDAVAEARSKADRVREWAGSVDPAVS